MPRSPDDPPTWCRLLVTRPRPEVALLAVIGELDTPAAERVTDCLQRLHTPDTEQLAVDLSGTTFMGSAGVAALLAARHRAGTVTTPRGPAPALHLLGVDGNPPVRHVLRILGLDTRFSTFPDLDAYLRHLPGTGTEGGGARSAPDAEP